MITLRTLDGALKWAFLDFLREEWRAGQVHVSKAHSDCTQESSYRY